MASSSSTPTTQWTRFDEPPLLGTMAPVYLAEENGIVGIATNSAEATHMLQRDAATGIVGVEVFAAGVSQLIERNNVIIPARVPEV